MLKTTYSLFDCSALHTEHNLLATRFYDIDHYQVVQEMVLMYVQRQGP